MTNGSGSDQPWVADLQEMQRLGSFYASGIRPGKRGMVIIHLIS